VAQAKAAAEALGKTGSGGGVSDGLEELNMEEYDDEDDEPELLSAGGRGDLYYENNEEDPHLIRNNDDDGDEDDEEIEDMTIKPTDMLIVCAHNEDEFNSLQVSIVEELEDGDLNMYVHHEVPLSDFPLYTAWMDFNFKDAKKEGNFIAVGTMDPAIEIWNLDIVDEVKPHIVLGGLSKNKEKVKGEKGKKLQGG
uniref:Periodic tryptophan protein 1 n=1 Tax=Aegilops tauschii subsp. strangulata TaxID=200361 RepID=A0A453GD89_AEGTS